MLDSLPEKRDIPEDRKLVIKEMSKLHGDHKTVWDITNDDEVGAARELFNSLKDKGFTAFHVKPDGTAGGRMDKFDSKAGSLIMVPPRKGG